MRSLRRVSAYDAGVIESTANPRIKAIRRLHSAKGRREAGRTLLEGPNGIEALRASEVLPTDILMLEDDADTAAYASAVGIDATVVSEDVLRSASDTMHPHGPLCVIGVPALGAVRSRRTVCLVNVADPGNVGTIVRTAAALGWDVAVHGSTADPWSPKALRASAGATLRVSVAMSPDPPNDAAAAGLAGVALVVAGGSNPRPYDGPVMLLVGSEAHGLPTAMVHVVGDSMTIPMSDDVESLNAAVASALAMYALGGGAFFGGSQ